MARSRRRRAVAKGGRRSRGRKKSNNKLAVQVALKKGRGGVGVGVVSATASRSSGKRRSSLKKKQQEQEQQRVFWRKLLAAVGSALGAGCIYVVGNMAFALCVWTLYAGAAIFTVKFLFRRSVIAWAWRQRSLFF